MVGLLTALMPVRSTAATPPDVSALIASLAQPLPAQTAYFEQRESPLLSEPLAFSGELQRPALGELIKRVAVPQIERTRIADGRVTIEREGQPARQFSLKRAPELIVLTSSFEAILSGDFGLLKKHYEIAIEGMAEAWSIRLVPRDARLAKRVLGLQLLGSGGDLRCIDLVLAGGESSRMWLGEAASVAERATDKDVRNALCSAQVIEGTSR